MSCERPAHFERNQAVLAARLSVGSRHRNKLLSSELFRDQKTPTPAAALRNCGETFLIRKNNRLALVGNSRRNSPGEPSFRFAELCERVLLFAWTLQAARFRQPS